MNYEDREEIRRALRDAFATASDELLARLVREVQADIPIGANGRVEPMHQWSWDWREALLTVAMERLDERVPETPRDLLVDELANATWCVMHTGWASHDMEVRRWVRAWADVLADSLAASASAASEPR